MRMLRVSLCALIGVLLSFGTVTAAAAQAGSQPPDSALSEAQLTAFAKAHAAIITAREQAHAELALPRNKTNELQRELRDKLQKRVDQILKENSLTQTQFARITYVISSDTAQRKSFEAILARLSGKQEAR
jgi:hypothetical protein